jgi:hypothetical protein
VWPKTGGQCGTGGVGVRAGRRRRRAGERAAVGDGVQARWAGVGVVESNMSDTGCWRPVWIGYN